MHELHRGNGIIACVDKYGNATIPHQCRSIPVLISMLGIIVSLVLAGFYATIENDIEFSQYCIGHASRLICATCLLAILDDLALMSEAVS